VSKIILTLYVLTTCLGLIILKTGTKTGLPISFAGNKLHLNLNVYSLAGLALYGLSFILYVYLISKFELGYIIPLAAAFVYIIVFIASAIVFKEAFTVTKVLGITLILSGLVLLNLNR
jgi:drug/metabolite transporter (DMT)-like permease